MPSVYDIMVALELDDKASEGLKGVGENFAKLAEQLETVTEGFHGLSAAVVGGAGLGLLLGLEKITSGADELATSLAKVKVAGGDAEAALTAARRASEAVPGTTTGGNVELMRRLSPIIGEQTALSAAPDIARAAWWLEFYKQDAQSGLIATAQQARARGLSGQRFTEFLGEQMKTIQAAGGNLTPQQLAMMQQRLGAPGMGFSEDFINNILPATALEMPGGRSAAGFAANLGKLTEGFEKGPRGKKGAMAGVDAAAFKAYVTGPTGAMPGQGRTSEFISNPYEWSQIAAESFVRKFGNDPRALTEIAGRIFGPMMGARVADYMLHGRFMEGAESPYETFRQGRGAAPGLDAEAQEAITRTAPEMAIKRIKADFNEIFEVIGMMAMPERLKQLNLISDTFEKFNSWLRHLEDTKEGREKAAQLFQAVEILGAMMTSLALLKIAPILLGGPAAPVVLAAGAVALLFTAIGGMPANEVTRAVNEIMDSFNKFIAWLFGTSDKAKDGVASIISGPGARGGVPSPGMWTGLEPPGWFTPGHNRGGFFNSGVTWDTAPAPTFADRFGSPNIVSGPAPPTGPFPSYMQPGIPVPFRGIGGPSGGGVPFSFTPAAPASSTLMPSFSPSLPRSENNANINVVLTLDGHTLGSTLLQRILSMYDFSETGSGANWNAGFPGADMPR